MSLPKFPCPPTLSTKDSLNMIISSIALEEVALSNLINAESNKIEYILSQKKEQCCCFKQSNNADILSINKSVKSVLEEISHNQLLLKAKMECAVDALEKLCSNSCDCHYFFGCHNKCYKHCHPLMWQMPCDNSINVRLLNDFCTFAFCANKKFSISFTIDLSVFDPAPPLLSIDLIKDNCPLFSHHTPILMTNHPFTITLNSIIFCTHNHHCTLKLIPSTKVKIHHSTITFTELQ